MRFTKTIKSFMSIDENAAEVFPEGLVSSIYDLPKFYIDGTKKQ
jgi:hypothetical protein